MDWVKAHHLDGWSGTRDSQQKLPEIVRRLICASITDVTLIRFPSGDAVGMTGWDGILEAGSITDPYVPAGLSVWEFGTGQVPKQKASADYKKRIEDPRGVDRQKTTYVAVTSRQWDTTDKKAWVDQRKERGEWLDVKAYDAVDLEAWLRDRPPVGVWLAEALNLMPDGIQSMEEEWLRWCQSTRPHMLRAVPLAGRKQESVELLRLLEGEPQPIVVLSGSPEEALAFVAASIEDSSTHAAHIFPRAVVVRDKQVARQLSAHSGLVVALLEGADEISGRLAQRGNHVIIPVGNVAVEHRTTIKLPLAGRQDFTNALKDMCGEEAERLAIECGRSATILRRRRHAGQYDIPEWAGPSQHRALIPALLAGGWDENFDADKAVLASLAGVTEYAQVETQLHQLSNVKDPPLRRVNSVWKLSAPVDAFALLARQLTRTDFDRFASAAQRVLGEKDPSLDLPPSERIYAGLRGQTLTHSHYLRAGIAEMALLIATLGSTAGVSAIADPEGFIDGLIRGLFSGAADWHGWGSLRDVLRVLAEAAPDPFLETLEQQLDGHASDFANIFSESGMFGGGSPHTGLLWSLETLSWSPARLARAGLALARLSRIAPQNISNNPIDSLRGIFLCWHPNTNANLDQRLAALDTILKDEPETGWQLLTLLLPEYYGIGHAAPKPEWREFGSAEREILTPQIVLKGFREITGRVLDRVGADPERWATLLDHVHELHPEDRHKALELLRANAGAFGEHRTTVWNKLRNFVNHHRAFPTAQWSLRAPELAQWEQVSELLRPTDIVAERVWLFNDYFPRVPVPMVDHSASQDMVLTLRRKAISDIFAAQGVDGVLSLVEMCKYPELVALVVPQERPIEECMSMVSRTIAGSDSQRHFARVLSAAGLSAFGTAWRDKLLQTIRDQGWEGKNAARLLERWPDEPATWDIVASFGTDTEEAYWATKPVLPVTLSTEDKIRSIRKLSSAKRCSEAINAYAFVSKGLPGALLVELLTCALQELNDPGSRPARIDLDLNIAEVFEALYDAGDVDHVSIARLEYAYLPLLAHTNKQPLKLHWLLSEDPSFFVDVLTHVYKSASGESEVLDENMLRRAERSRDVLWSWRIIPGSHQDGAIDENKLVAWVQRARELGANADRAGIADQQIGRVLAHSPSDPDGAWPHRAVRRVFEIIHSRELERGFEIECYNKRGAHARDPEMGGAPERELEDQYRTWAKIVAAAFPLTSGLLNRVADTWHQHAKLEDDRAAKWKLDY